MLPSSTRCLLLRSTRHFSKKVDKKGTAAEAAQAAAQAAKLRDQLYQQSNTPFAVTHIPTEKASTKNQKEKVESIGKQKRRERTAAEANERIAIAEVHNTAEKLNAAEIPIPTADNITELQSLKSFSAPSARPSPSSSSSSPSLKAYLETLEPEQRKLKLESIREARESMRSGIDAIERLSRQKREESVRDTYERSMKEQAQHREKIVQQVSGSISIDPSLHVESDGRVHNPLNVDHMPEAFRVRLPPELMGISPLTKRRLLEEGKTVDEFRIPEYVLQRRIEHDSMMSIHTDITMTIDDYDDVVRMVRSDKAAEKRFNAVLHEATRGFTPQTIAYLNKCALDTQTLRELLATLDPKLTQEKKVAEKFIRLLGVRFKKLGLDDIRRLPKEKREAVLDRLNTMSLDQLQESISKKTKKNQDIISEDAEIVEVEAEAQEQKVSVATKIKIFLSHFRSKQAFISYVDQLVIKLQKRAAHSRTDAVEAKARPAGKVSFPTKFFLAGTLFILTSFSLTTFWDYYMEMEHGIEPPSSYSN